MQKLTKIVATVGPSTEDKAMLKQVIEHGANVIRFNLKHNDLSWHEEIANRVRVVASELKYPVGILMDLQGPEIRMINPLGEFEIKVGEKMRIVKTEKEANEGDKYLILSHPHVLKYGKKGTRISIDDGKLEFVIHTADEKSWTVISESDGVVKTRKTLNIPDEHFPMDVLTDRDLEAVKMSAKLNAEFVALSFVRDANDINSLRQEMAKYNYKAKIVAKIETKMAIANLDEILDASDAVMVARGDLGIELPYPQVPYYQKIMIKKCIERGIPVITATQMLQSMVDRPYASRAEISDVANAVYDNTDAVMLSEESAAGKYPLKAVEIQAKTVAYIESHKVMDIRLNNVFKIEDQEGMLTDAAYNLLLQFGKREGEIGGFIVFTQTGRTARMLSRYRPRVPIFAFTPDDHIMGMLTLNFGVYPLVQPDIYKKKSQVTNEDIQKALIYLEKKGLIDRSKYYILMHGDAWMIEGKMSTIKVISPK